MRYSRRVLCFIGVWCFALAVTMATTPQQAAAQVFTTEVQGTKIASALETALAGTKVHLHNLGPLKDGTYYSDNASSVKWPITAGPGLRTYFTIQEASQAVLGRRYSYFVNHVRSEGLFVASGNDSFTVTITLKSVGPALVGKCVRVRAPVRDCLGLGEAEMPPILWNDAKVDIEMLPVRVGSSLAFEVRNVTIGGGFVVGQACDLPLVGVRLCATVTRVTEQMRAKVGAQVKASLNSPKIRKSVAAAVRDQLNTTAQIPILGVRSVAMSGGVVRIGLGLGQ
jgi:hypothetical protein